MSRPFELVLSAVVGLLLAVTVAGCLSWLNPDRCDHLKLTTERDPGTSLPVIAARCGSRLVWRDVCRNADISGGWLYCDGVRSVAIAGDVTRSAQ